MTMSRTPTVQDWARIKQAGFRVIAHVPYIGSSRKGWELLDPEGHNLMIGSHGQVAPTQYEAVAEALSRIEQDERLTTGAPTTLPVKHLPLEPFDSPPDWQCRCNDFEPHYDETKCGTCDHGPHRDRCEFVHTRKVQRRAGSKDDRISADKTYFAKIHGRWYFGRFSTQHFGWNFDDWGTSGLQLDSIEDLYEVDLSALEVRS
jgi:hypothetical protein